MQQALELGLNLVDLAKLCALLKTRSLGCLALQHQTQQ